MPTLYELTADYKTVLDMLDNPEIDPQCIADTLEAIGGEIEDKADGYAKVITEANMQIGGLKAQIDRLTERKKTIENNIKNMKKSLADAMIAVDKPKFKTLLFSFNVQKNPPKLVIDKPDDIPSEYLIPQPPKVDSKPIIEAIKEGATFKFAHCEQSEGVRIR